MAVSVPFCLSLRMTSPSWITKDKSKAGKVLPPTVALAMVTGAPALLSAGWSEAPPRPTRFEMPRLLVSINSWGLLKVMLLMTSLPVKMDKRLTSTLASSLDDAKVDVNLLSIFTGKLVINSITFNKPQLLIETNSRGISNLVGLGGASDQPADNKAGAPVTIASATVGGKTFPALLLSLVIQDGDVILRDKQKGTETAIHGLNIKLQGLSLAAAGASRLEADMVAEFQGKKIPLSLNSDFKLDLPNQRVDIQSMELKAPALHANLMGSIQSFDKPVIDLRVGVDVDLQKLPDLLPPATLAKLPSDLKTRGSIKLDLTTQGAIARPKELALKGTLSFQDVNAVYGTYPALSDLKGTLSFNKAGLDLPDLL